MKRDCPGSRIHRVEGGVLGSFDRGRGEIDGIQSVGQGDIGVRVGRLGIKLGPSSLLRLLSP